MQTSPRYLFIRPGIAAAQFAVKFNRKKLIKGLVFSDGHAHHPLTSDCWIGNAIGIGCEHMRVH